MSATKSTWRRQTSVRLDSTRNPPDAKNQRGSVKWCRLTQGETPASWAAASTVAVVMDGGRVVDTGLGLEPRPLHGEPVVGQPEAGEEREVLGITGAEAVAVTRQRGVARALPLPPVRGGRGPSHCVDDAPVPHQKTSGHCMSISMTSGR